MNNKPLIALLIIVLIAIGYYVFHVLPEKAYLQNSIRCQEMGMKAYEKDSERYDPLSIFDPKFYFVKETSTCLYWGGHTDTKSDYTQVLNYSIKDVYQNKEIGSWSSGGVLENNRDKYEEYYSKYFKGY